MRVIDRSLLCAVAAFAAFAAAGDASAVQQRSFVASDGLDTNVCTRAAPCRSFASAIAQTLPGGEVVVIDSAGYGPVTISGPISLIAPPGVYAGISVSSGIGVNVTAGSSDIVVLRGLSINNVGTGTAGIVAASGLRVVIDRCSISGFGAGGSGLSLTTTLFTGLDVTDTVIRDNTTGVQLSGPQFLSQVTLTRVRIESNGTGVDASGGALFLRLVDSAITGSSGDGFHVNPTGTKTVRFEIQRSEIIGNNVAVNAAAFNVGANILGSIADSLVSENGSFGIYANAAAGAFSTLYVTNCIVRYDGTGLRAQQAGSTIVFRNNVIADNAFGIQAPVGGAMVSGGGNTMYNNTTPGAPTSSVPPI